MGATTSSLKRLVKEEHTRLQKHRDFLVLDDVLEFQLSLSGWRLDPAHLGVLLAVDSNRDGCFQESEVLAFAHYVHKRAAEFQQYELQSMVHGRCMLELWRQINTDQGLTEIVDWLMRVVKRNHAAAGAESGKSDGARARPPLFQSTSAAAAAVNGRVSARLHEERHSERDYRPRTFEHHPETLYLHKNSLHGMHRILGNHGGSMTSFDTFLNILQRLAEERQLLELSNTDLDDWVPEQVLRTYIRQVLSNMRQLVSDMDVLQDLLQEHPS